APRPAGDGSEARRPGDVPRGALQRRADPAGERRSALEGGAAAAGRPASLAAPGGGCDAGPQGGVPALLLQASAPRGPYRARPDGGAARPAQDPAPAAGADPPGGGAAALGAEGDGAGGAT